MTVVLAAHAKPRPALRRPLVVAALAIGAFQVADVLTTHRLLASGYHEINPLAGALIAAGWLFAAKALLGAGLVARCSRVRPTVTLLCTTWAVAGAYFAIALGNSMALMR